MTIKYKKENCSYKKDIYFCASHLCPGEYERQIAELEGKVELLEKEKELWFSKYHEVRQEKHKMKNYQNCKDQGFCSTKTIIFGENCPCDKWEIGDGI